MTTQIEYAHKAIQEIGAKAIANRHLDKAYLML